MVAVHNDMHACEQFVKLGLGLGFVLYVLHVILCSLLGLQCFDSVGWVAV